MTSSAREAVKTIRLTEPVVGIEEAEAVRRVLESGWLAEGEETRQFENEIARYVGASHAVAVTNCTVALELCLRALNINGTVATPAFGHPATIRAIVNAGCSPVFVDVSPRSYNVDTDIIIDNRVNACIPVSWGGNPLKPRIPTQPIIEDGACSLGATSAHGLKTGMTFTATCFSFHPRKLITTGEGGIVTTNSPELAETLRRLKNFGYSNCKFDDIRAAIGRTQLKKLPEIIRRRVSMAQVYGDLLSEVESVIPPYMSKGHTYQTYAVYLVKGDRELIIQRLKKKGIETQIGAHYLPRMFGVFKISGTENAYNLAMNLLALPMSHSISDEDQKTVVEALKKELR